MKWSLVIATYNRIGALQNCLKFALTQSVLPADIVIIDASDRWETNRHAVLKQIARSGPPGIQVCYEQARSRNVTSQRNQGIAHAIGDVLFLIDDDSFMYPTCAEEVMKIYEADVRGRVAGVAPLETDRAPLASNEMPNPIRANNGLSVWAGLDSLVRALSEWELRVDRLCLPYDDEYPDHPVPSELEGMAVGTARYFSGFRMTFRAPVIRNVQFDETLKRYAAAEDLDASYRASRHGALLNALKAQIFHARAAEARLSLHTRTLIGLLNLAYLYRRHGRQPTTLLGAYRWRLLRRLAVDIVRDAARKRFSLPCARADVKTLMLLSEIVYAEDDRIVSWYQVLQEQILSENVS